MRLAWSVPRTDHDKRTRRARRLVLRPRGALFRCVGHARSCVFQIAVRRPVATRSKPHHSYRFFFTAHESESASAHTHVERLRFPIRTTALRQRATPRRTHTCGVRRAAAGAVAAFSPSSLDCQDPRHLTTGERGPGYVRAVGRETRGGARVPHKPLVGASLFFLSNGIPSQLSR